MSRLASKACYGIAFFFFTVIIMKCSISQDSFFQHSIIDGTLNYLVYELSEDCSVLHSKSFGNFVQRMYDENCMNFIIKSNIVFPGCTIKITTFGYYVGNILNAHTDCVMLCVMLIEHTVRFKSC
jgi:hypothetical protein